MYNVFSTDLLLIFKNQENKGKLNEYERNAIQEFLQYAKDIVNLEDDIDYCVRRSEKELTN